MTGTDLAANVPDVPDDDPWVVSAQVARYAADLRGCSNFAEVIVDTPFVPASFWPAPVIHRGSQITTMKASGRDGWDFRRRHPHESDDDYAWRRRNAVATTAAVIYSGATLGLSWQAAVSGIYVANGRTSLYAEQVRALVLAAGHDLQIRERTAQRCRLSVRRRGEKEFTDFTYSMDEAIESGYVKGKGPNADNDWGGNDRYNTNAADMLIARCTSIAAKGKFADVIRGMHTRELLADERPDPVDITASVDVSPSPERPDRAAILAAAEKGRTETLAEAAPPDPDSSRAALPISPTTWKMITSMLKDLGVAGPGQSQAQLAVVWHLVGRRVERGSDLTADEGRMLVDTLAANGARIVWGVLGPDAGFRLVPPDEEQDQAADEMGGADPDTDDDDPATDPGLGHSPQDEQL